MRKMVRLILVGLTLSIAGVVLYAENGEENAAEGKQPEQTASAEENAQDITVSAGEITESPASERKSYQLGLEIVPVPKILHSHFGITEESRGLTVIGQVFPGSPAEKAGLKSGDVILLFGGKEISNRNDLVVQLSTVKDTEQKMSVIRAGKPLEITVKPEPIPVVSMMHPGHPFPMGQFPQGMFPPGMGMEREFFVTPHAPHQAMEYLRKMQGGQFLNLPPANGIEDGSSKRLEVTTKTDKDGKTTVRVNQVTRTNGQTEEKSWEAESVDQLPEEIRKEVQTLFRVQ